MYTRVRAGRGRDNFIRSSIISLIAARVWLLKNMPNNNRAGSVAGGCVFGAGIGIGVRILGEAIGAAIK